jgi:hypothetical protein
MMDRAAQRRKAHGVSSDHVGEEPPVFHVQAAAAAEEQRGDDPSLVEEDGWGEPAQPFGGAQQPAGGGWAAAAPDEHDAPGRDNSRHFERDHASHGDTRQDHRRLHVERAGESGGVVAE